MWTCETTNTACITATLHFIDSNSMLQKKILATRSMDDVKIAQSIKEVVKDILHGNEAIKINNVFITDNGTNVKASFKDNIWIPSSIHSLNLVLTQGCEANGNDVEQMTVLINNCKKIFTHQKVQNSISA